jgi:cobalt ECF transporter T component CbiQ
VSTARNLWVIGCVYLLVVCFALASAIPADFFIRRVWLAVPLFTGLIALPALFMVPGQPLLHLPFGLIVTRTGAQSVLFLLLRVSTSLSIVLLLILTTPWNTVLAALSVLKVPDVFILILGMTIRYIYLLLHIANDMFLSRKSRVIGRMSGSEERHMLAAIGATLLSKSLNMSSEVYLAMVSRGYRGAVVTFKPFRMRRQDWCWAAFFMAITVLIIYLGR